MTDPNQKQRKLTIVNDYVARAFWEILKTGTQPTIDSVIQWLIDNDLPGRNRNSISEGLKKCWSEIGHRVKEYGTLPGVSKEAQEAFIPLWNTLLDVSKREFEQFRVELIKGADEKVAAAHKDVLIEVSKNLAAEQTIVRQTIDLKTLQETFEQAQIDIKNKEKKLHENDVELSVLRTENTAFQIKIKDLDILIAATISEHKETLKKEAFLYVQEKKSLQNAIDQERTSKKIVESKFNALLIEKENIQNQLHTSTLEHAKHMATIQQNLGEARGEAIANAKQLLVMEDRLTHLSASSTDMILHNAELMHKINALKESETGLKNKLQNIGNISPEKLHRILLDAFLHGKEIAPSLESPIIQAGAYARKTLNSIGVKATS